MKKDSDKHERDRANSDNETDATRKANSEGRSVGRRGFLAGLGTLGAAGFGGEAVTGAGNIVGVSHRQDITAQNTTAQDTTTTTTQAGNGAATLEDARDAVIRVDTEGTFVLPGDAGVQANTPGGGSGFIIDPSGIAVTANHVVTGAGTLEVVTGEDLNRTYNARVLGASECADLAVIDIAGSDFPSLDWASESEIKPLTEVFALGFPFSPGGFEGQYRYSVTRGIISQTDADGETSWASVDSVIQHDAEILPGNSGGPLVTSEGRVVGVNYAGVFGFGSLSFAIGQQIARGVVDRLRQGENHEWIGINGQAWLSDTGGVSGIWVASVASGSPADEAGIRAGDVITTMEGLSLATEGTIETYCDILRSRAPGDQLKIEVLRQQTGELLVGEVNGDPLQAVPGEPVVPPTEQFQTVTDATGTIRVTTPSTWTDIRNGVYPNGDPEVIISPDTDAYLDTWNVPGFIARVRSDANPNDLQSALETEVSEFGSLQEQCASATDSQFTNAYLTGVSRRLNQCGGTGTSNVFIAARTVSGTPRVITANVQLVSPDDERAYGQIAASLQLLGTGQVTGGEPTTTETADGGDRPGRTTAPDVDGQATTTTDG